MASAKKKSSVDMRAPKGAEVNEVLKCGADPIYFINKYCKIQHPTRGTIDFNTYPFQDKCVKAFKKHQFNIIVKSRQLGLSTVTAGYAVWLALFRRDQNILVMAQKLRTAKTFIRKVHKMLACLPPWLRLCNYEQNQQEVRFDNGSQIVSIPTTEDAGRSEALSLLIVDEAAIIRNFEEIWASIYPTLSEGGRAIILSTPNGMGGQYHDLWVGAETNGLSDDAVGKNGFHPIKLPWDVHPEHDESWFQKQVSKLGPRKSSQELLCVATDTKIVTPDGYTLVQDIKPGDLVLTHKGRFKPVRAIASRKVRNDEKLYSISSPGNRKDPVIATGNHPILAYRYWDNNDRTLDFLVKNADRVQPTWLPLDEYALPQKRTIHTVGVLHPVLDASLLEQRIDVIDLSELYPSKEITQQTCRYERQWGNTRRYVEVGYELGKFVGFYLAEGCQGHLNGLDLAFHSNEMETHAAWCAAFLEKLGCRVTVEKHRIHNSCRVWTFNKHVGALVRSFVKGNNATNKQLDFELVLSCGKEFVRGLLEGHFLGDGDHKHTKKTKVVSASYKLLYQLRTLNSAFNLYPRLGSCSYVRDSGYEVFFGYLEFQADRITYEDLLVNGQQYKKQSRTRLLNEAFVGKQRLDDVTFLAANGDFEVWDIEVEDDHSFVAGSTIFHNCDFLSSGETFLQSYTMEWIAQEVRAPLKVEGPENNVWIYEEPVQGHKYVLGADVSRGDAKDFSAFVIINMATGNMALEYRGKVFPDGLADLIDQYGRRYNNSLAVVEANTFGNHTLIELKKKNYQNMYYHTAPAHAIENFYPSSRDRCGFSTQTNTRMDALARFEDTMRCHHMTPKSSRLYDELQSFVYVNSGDGNEKQRPQAKKGKHDDLVMATAIACWVYRTHFENYRLSFRGKNIGASVAQEKPLFMYMSKTSSKYSSMPARNPLHPNVAISTDGPLKPQNVELDIHQLKWLVR